MTIEEFSKFAMGLKSFFPADNILPNEVAMRLWYEELKDIPYGVAEAFLKKWIRTNGKAPTMADIIQGTVDMTTEEIPEWEDEWNKVVKAIGSYGMNREEEVYGMLRETTVETLKGMGGFRNLCIEGNLEVDRANFRDIYKRKRDRERQNQCLPASLKHTMANIKAEALGSKPIEIEKRDYDFAALEEKLKNQPIGD